MNKVRTLYVNDTHFNAALSNMLKKDTETPIEIPPENYDALRKSGITHDCLCPGHFSYAQAAHIAEQHLLEGVILRKGTIECKNPRGLSYTMCYALSVWSGVDREAALSNAESLLYPELPDPEVCKLSQKKKGVANPDDIVRMAGPKAAKILFNALRAGPRVILRSAFELLKANTITRVLSAVVLLFIDTINLIRKRISKKQFIINTVLALMMTVGGTVGWLLGTQTVGTVLMENAVLAIAAGIAGAGVLGAGLGMLWEKAVRRFFRDDTQDMMEILNTEFAKLSREYLLNDREVEELTEAITIKPKNLKAIFAQQDRAEFARCTLEPYVAGVVCRREKVVL